MRILYTNFHGTDGGGHVTYVLSLARALAAEHTVTIATPASSRLYRFAQGLTGVRTVHQPYTTRIGALIPETNRLRQLISAGQFDVVHVNGSADHRHVMTACLGRRTRPAIVWTKHNDHRVNSIGHRIRARLATDHVIAVSDFIAAMLRGSAYTDLPVSVIRHGVDTAYFAPVSPIARRAARQHLFGQDCDDAIVLGSSGGTDYDKGWLDLLAALALLPAEARQRFRVMVAGKLPDDDKMARVIELGVQDLVVFPGLVQDVRPLLAACDIGFVLSYREALSYACREVMALGLPALVSRVGGLPENVEDGVDGWIVPARSPAAIRDVLTRILEQPELVPRLGAAARQRSLDDFALAPFVRATLGVYDAALRRRGSTDSDRDPRQRV